MTVKNDCLDIKVACPYTGQPVILRYVSESLYEKYYQSYPDLFEEEEIKKTIKKIDADTITDTE